MHSQRQRRHPPPRTASSSSSSSLAPPPPPPIEVVNQFRFDEVLVLPSSLSSSSSSTTPQRRAVDPPVLKCDGKSAYAGSSANWMLKLKDVDLSVERSVVERGGGGDDGGVRRGSGGGRVGGGGGRGGPLGGRGRWRSSCPGGNTRSGARHPSTETSSRRRRRRLGGGGLAARRKGPSRAPPTRMSDVAKRPEEESVGGIDNARMAMYHRSGGGQGRGRKPLRREVETRRRDRRDTCRGVGCRSSSPNVFRVRERPRGARGEGRAPNYSMGGGLWRSTTFLLRRASRPRTKGGLER